MQIVFMGTPDFAVGALEALITQGHEITAVVTQPDKPKGRSKELQFPPVKECAVKHGIPVFQPRRIKTPEAIEELKKYPADIYIVAAFGQILSQEILDLPKYGCLNIHASLLPKLPRGISYPESDHRRRAETGVTIMQMNAGLDTGDMLYRKKIPITSEDTFETLHDKLMVLGGEAITEALPLLEAGKLVPEKQDDTKTCYAALITKEMGKLDFTKTAAELDRLIRGLTPWPSAYTHYHGKQLKIWKAIPMATAHKEAPGTILTVNKDSFEVAASEGSLKVMELQLEGKKRMTTHDFLLGVKVQPGRASGRALGYDETKSNDRVSGVDRKETFVCTVAITDMVIIGILLIFWYWSDWYCVWVPAHW